METTNIILNRQSSEPITKRELQSLLSMLNKGYEFDTVIFGCGYIQEIIRMAIDSFEDKKEHRDYES